MLRNRYLFFLFGERFIFLLIGLVKIAVILSRLKPSSYVEYVSLIGFITLIGTLGRLGIEIYIKKELPNKLLSLNSEKGFYYFLIQVTSIPILSLIIISLLSPLLTKTRLFTWEINYIFLAILTILSSLIGLIYEIQISTKETKFLVANQVSYSLISVMILYFLLPDSSNLRQIIPLLLIIHFVGFLISLASLKATSYKIFRKSKTPDTEIENLSIKNLVIFIKGIISKIKITFLFLITGLIIRLVPISLLKPINPLIPSFALLITLLDTASIFYRQISNYLIIQEKSVIRKYNQNIIPLVLFSMLISSILTIWLFKTNFWMNFINSIIPAYASSITFAISFFGFPILILLLITSINEGYLINLEKLNSLVKLRVFIAFIIITLISLNFLSIIEHDLIIIVIYSIGEFLLALTTVFLIKDFIGNTKFYTFILIHIPIGFLLFNLIIQSQY